MSQPESQHAGLELRHESWTAMTVDCWRSELIAQPFTIVAKRYGLAMRVKACKLGVGRAPAGDAMHRCSSPLLIALHERLSRASHD